MMRRRFTVLLAIATASALLVFGCGGSDGDDAHSPGSIDASFDPGTNINDWVNCIAVQPDGKILAGIGSDASAPGALVRLNENGSADGTFSGWTGVDRKITCIALQGDGKILIGGLFTTVNGVSRGRIARLNADGGLDAGFSSGAGANGSIGSIVVNADGTIMIAGSFTAYDGANKGRFTRLTANGSVDATFQPSGSGFSGSVSSFAAAPDGGFFASGGFTSYEGVDVSRLVKLDSDGNLVTGFIPPVFDCVSFNGLAPRADGSIVVTGDFEQIGGASHRRIARLTSTGALDASFDPGAGVVGGDGEGSGAYGLTMQPDGKVLIGGYFNHYDGVLHYSTARINEDGSLDTSFVTDPFFQNGVDTKQCFAIQPDGKILMGGNFSICGGQVRRYIARVWP